MISVVQQRPTDFKLPIHNWEALAQLRKEKYFFSKQSAVAGGAAIATGTFFSPGLLLFALAYPPLVRVEKITRLETVTSLLLEKFADQQIQVFPVQRIDKVQGIETQNPIDLFVRFPRKTHIFISIRSKGDSEVVYNEAREILQVKRRNRSGLVTWKPCPLVELSDYERWLNKNRNSFELAS